LIAPDARTVTPPSASLILSLIQISAVSADLRLAASCDQLGRCRSRDSRLAVEASWKAQG